jgi:hypothetical protein
MLFTRLLKAVGPGYVRAHTHAARHRNEIERSEQCGCFYCLETFVPGEIQDWTDDGATAMCPRCGIDSVLGSASGFSFARFSEPDAPLLVRAQFRDQDVAPRSAYRLS